MRSKFHDEPYNIPGMLEAKLYRIIQAAASYAIERERERAREIERGRVRGGREGEC